MKIFPALVGLAFVVQAHPPAIAASAGDCYNRAILECGLIYGGKDYGDARYKRCIKDLLDECDRANSRPGMRDLTTSPRPGKG